jgi:hypothetical protein
MTCALVAIVSASAGTMFGLVVIACLVAARRSDEHDRRF